MAFPVVEVIGAALTAILGLPFLRKKRYCLWIRRPAFWMNLTSTGLPLKDCQTARAEIMAKLNLPESDFLILAKGANPPETK